MSSLSKRVRTGYGKHGLKRMRLNVALEQEKEKKHRVEGLQAGLIGDLAPNRDLIMSHYSFQTGRATTRSY
jgi:hypothetical protein